MNSVNPKLLYIGGIGEIFECDDPIFTQSRRFIRYDLNQHIKGEETPTLLSL